MFDHLLNEDTLDRFVRTADIGNAQAMERQGGGEAGDRQDDNDRMAARDW
jgi:hypothetical protein